MENETTYINGKNKVQVLDSTDLTNHTQTVNKQELRKYWSREYMNQKMDLINNQSHKMLIKFLWMSGVRISEAITLIKENIDFQDYFMTVKWLKSRKYNQRVVPIHPNLKEILQVFSASKNGTDRIFPISRQRAWQLTQKYLNGNPHKIRHSFAVNWLKCGGDLVTLHRILGHAKIQTTMEYLKIVPVDQGKELIKIRFT